MHPVFLVNEVRSQKKKKGRFTRRFTSRENQRSLRGAPVCIVLGGLGYETPLSEGIGLRGAEIDGFRQVHERRESKRADTTTSLGFERCGSVTETFSRAGDWRRGDANCEGRHSATCGSILRFAKTVAATREDDSLPEPPRRPEALREKLSVCSYVDDSSCLSTFRIGASPGSGGSEARWAL